MIGVDKKGYRKHIRKETDLRSIPNTAGFLEEVTIVGRGARAHRGDKN